MTSRPRCAQRIAIALLLLVVLAGTARAEDPPEPAAEAAVPDFVPLAEIAARSEDVAAEIREFEQGLEIPAEIDAIGDEISGRAEAVQKARVELSTRMGAGASLATIEELARGWRTRDAELEPWSQTLEARVRALAAVQTRLAEMAVRWERTWEHAGQAGAPRALLDQIRSTRADIDRTAKAVSGRGAAVLTLASQVAAQHRSVTEVMDELAAARDELRANLLEPDRRPLWVALVTAAEGEPTRTRVVDSLSAQAELLRAFVALRWQRILLHLLLLLGILGFARVLSRRAAGWSEEDPELGGEIRMLERPFSMALLITMLLSPLLYPLAPRAGISLLSLLWVVPVLRLLPPVVPRALRPALYALVAFHVTDRLRELVDAVPLAEQLLFDAELTGAVVFGFWLLRPSRLRRVDASDLPPRWVGRALRIAVGLLGLALVADVLGYSALGHVLGEGLLASGYAGIVLYGAMRVLRLCLTVALHTRGARSFAVVRLRGRLLLRWGERLLGALALLAWLLTSLAGFEVRDVVLAAVRAVLVAELHFGTLSVSLADLIAFPLVLGLALGLSTAVRFVLEEEVFPRVRLRRGIPHAITATVHYMVLLVGFVLAVGAAGVDFNRFTLLAGAFGVGLGFGLQNVVNNFVSGLVLLYERPIQVGDSLEIGGLLGEVKRIGIRSSTVRTWDGAEVIVPNGSLISDTVINWTLSDRQRRIRLPVGVSYGSDPERVLELLLGVARGHPAILADPEPAALFTAFGDSSLDFELRAWTANSSTFLATRSELAVGIYAALNQAGITIPFPQRDLHVVSLPEGLAGAVRRSDSRAGPE